MKGRETFKALAEGRTVYFPIRKMRFKMDSDGNLLVWSALCDKWGICDAVCGWVWMNECEIAKEYHLSFKDAMNEAMHGKMVANECYPEYEFRFDEFGRLLHHGPWEKTTMLTEDEIEAKWRVVE